MVRATVATEAEAMGMVEKLGEVVGSEEVAMVEAARAEDLAKEEEEAELEEKLVTVAAEPGVALGLTVKVAEEEVKEDEVAEVLLGWVVAESPVEVVALEACLEAAYIHTGNFEILESTRLRLLGCKTLRRRFGWTQLRVIRCTEQCSTRQREAQLSRLFAWLNMPMTHPGKENISLRRNLDMYSQHDER